MSSDLFRVNAHQKRVDVWLIYRCATCDFTWNHTVWTRATPDEIGRELYQRYLENDRETAWLVAFTTGATTELHRLEKSEEAAATAAPLVIEVSNPFKVGARLDRLLASELWLSRAALVRAVEEGEITLSSGSGALRKSVRERERVTIYSSSIISAAAGEPARSSASVIFGPAS